MRELYKLIGRGENPGAVMTTGSSREIDGNHVRTYFSDSEGEAATGILKAWQGQGRLVGFGL